MKQDINKIIKILKSGGMGVMPTDTLYGLVGSALSKKTVERIYKIKGRNEKKPLIILISGFEDFVSFGLNISKFVWPEKTSIIFSCPKTKLKKFLYLHRGTGDLAFRLPAKKSLIEILKKTGPLVVPSVNPEGLPPAKNIKEAQKYFGEKMDFYLDSGTLKSEPSTLIRVNKSGEIEVLRGILK
ncbi:MAG: L-threonylcarbamoyladenylate synthase [Patescibacteria group bacterium]